MIRRLRDLLAHARAGHRIGCETCASPACEGIPSREVRARRGHVRPIGEREHIDDWLADPLDHSGEPVVAPEPPGASPGVPATGSRPHTLYVADPDELTGEEWAPDDVQRRHVEQEHGGNPYDCLACAPFIVWRATDDLPARSPVDAARERGEI